uniref:Sec-independent protein translocase component TatC n=1 Tax=Rhodomelopsis africana TaxID=1917047 RepID=UPI0022FD64FA|nr:Sec-independent protein translocase component TatC [Rhodomelopsis africana]WAX04084.1 Sec-independent protein translocase component TatC [Rhodomelopsis africana]
MFFLFKELTFFLRYLTISFIFLFSYCFKKFPTILLFFYYPLGKFFKKKLLILHALELINSSLFLNLSISGFFVFIYLNFLLKFFFSSSWYSPQIKLFSNFIQLGFFSLTSSFFCFYLIYFFIFNLGLFWNFEIFSSFHLFEIQFQVLNFLKFQIDNLNLFCYFLFISITLSFISRWLFSWKLLFLLFRWFKFILFFFSSFCAFFFISEVTLQFFFALVFLYFFLEFIFFYICWKLQ